MSSASADWTGVSGLQDVPPSRRTRRSETSGPSTRRGSVGPVRRDISAEGSAWSIPSMASNGEIKDHGDERGYIGDGASQDGGGRPWRKPSSARPSTAGPALVGGRDHMMRADALGDLSNLSAVGSSEHGSDALAEEAEQAGSAVTTSRDASTAGGKLYYEMHTTRFEVARGSVERKQARERGFTAGALARINNI